MSHLEIVNITLFTQTLTQAGPLILAALGGLYSERTGTVNIALEGMLLMGAFFAYTGTYYSGNPWVGVLCAVLAGAMLALVHAVVTVTCKVDHIVSGIALNMLATGLAGYLLFSVFGSQGSTREFVKGLPTVHLTFLETIPVVGPVLAEVLAQGPLIYLALMLVGVSSFLFNKTILGLRMTAVGESPQTADSLGVPVERIQYLGVLLSGALAGLGGAQLSIGSLSQFVQQMSGGRGYIALAALILGRWRPSGVLWSCLLFGFLFSLADNMQGTGIAIPNDVFLILPFILTIVVVAGVGGKAEPPAFDGKPYIRES